MDAFLDLIVVAVVMAVVLAGIALAAVAVQVRASRRRARMRLERVLDALATRTSERLAAGRSPGLALMRYRRLTDDADATRTWRGLQMLLLRERALDGMDDALGRARLEADALLARLRRRPAADDATPPRL